MHLVILANLVHRRFTQCFGFFPATYFIMQNSKLKKKNWKPTSHLKNLPALESLNMSNYFSQYNGSQCNRKIEDILGCQGLTLWVDVRQLCCRCCLGSRHSPRLLTSAWQTNNSLLGMPLTPDRFKKFYMFSKFNELIF